MYQNITTIALAFAALNLDPTQLPDVSMLPEKDQKPILNHYQIIKVVEAINEGWKPDWSNYSQYKYVLWPDIEVDESKPSGFGFSYFVWTITGTTTYVGSRLCFETRDKAKHFFTHFQELYESYMLIDKE